MDRTVPHLPTDRLRVEAWPDPVVERHGHDPRSRYVERFWLGILGPSTVWLLRRLAAGLEDEPDGFELDLVDCAAALGLGNHGGRHSPFARAFVRLCQFGMARPSGAAGIQVRRAVPPLTRGQVVRLPEALQAEHERWLGQVASPAVRNADPARAVALAVTLVRAGESIDLVERRLAGWGFPEPIAAAAATQAWSTRPAPSPA